MYTVHNGSNHFYAQVGTVWQLAVFMAGFSLTVALIGHDEKCSNEGELVYVPLIAHEPCYTCYCRQGRVECELNKCPPLDGCYAILFNRPRGQCCNVCQGCTVNGTHVASGDTLSSSEDPCIINMCQAGVLTTTRVLCASPCKNPVKVPGQCCPSCSGCHYNGIRHEIGDKFTLKRDASVQCLCKAGNITCSKRTCPVLNCPAGKTTQEQGDTCPKCTDSRNVFETPRSCFFSGRVFNNDDKHQVDACTACVCKEGTMVCNRQECPVMNCPHKKQVTHPKSCCPTCSITLPCDVGKVKMKHNETWKKDKCTSCICLNGTAKCAARTCPHADIPCQKGFTAVRHGHQCCPVCTKDDGICSLAGQSSNQISTFDGVKYNIDGFCTHDLVQDCGQGQIRVKAKYKTKNKLRTSINIVTLRFNSTRIKLYRSSEIRINRTSLFSTQLASRDFTLKIKESRITVTVRSGLSLSWNMDDRLVVKISGDMFKSGRLCGLCGNFDGDLTNELMNRTGARIGNPNLMAQLWTRGKHCGLHHTDTVDSITTSDRKHFPHTPRYNDNKIKDKISSVKNTEKSGSTQDENIKLRERGRNNNYLATKLNN